MGGSFFFDCFGGGVGLSGIILCPCLSFHIFAVSLNLAGVFFLSF